MVEGEPAVIVLSGDSGDEMVEGTLDRSSMFYVLGYVKQQQEGPAIERGYTDSEWLLLDPVVVASKLKNCVEVFLVAKEPRTETEWETWLHRRDDLLFVQISMMVNNTTDGESCMDGMIEKYVNENTTTNSISSHMLDAYRIASGGKMHFSDGRAWAMTVENYDDLRRQRLGVHFATDKAWQRRFEISRQIDLARDVLALSERLAPFQAVAMVESDGSWERVYSMNNNTAVGGGSSMMLLKFTPLFDWYDVRILEDRETEALVEIDGLTRKLQRIDDVLERQRALLGLRDGGPRKRKRAATQVSV